MINRIFLCIVLLCISCAGTPKKTDDSFVCRDHGVHHLSVKEEFSACYGVDINRFNDYFLFSKESRVTGSEESTALALKNAVADEITGLIVTRLDAAFGAELLANWQLEKIDLPVVFRSFKRSGSDGTYIKVAAAALKSDFTPRALIRFLPLEYKMKLMKTDDKLKDLMK